MEPSIQLKPCPHRTATFADTHVVETPERRNRFRQTHNAVCGGSQVASQLSGSSTQGLVFFIRQTDPPTSVSVSERNTRRRRTTAPRRTTRYETTGWTDWRGDYRRLQRRSDCGFGWKWDDLEHSGLMRAARHWKRMSRDGGTQLSGSSEVLDSECLTGDV